MSTQPLSQTKSAARLGLGSTNLVWLGRRGRRNAKGRPVIFREEGWSRKAVTPKLMTASEAPISDPLGLASVTINFAPARGTAHAAQVRKKLSSEIETNLSLTDCVAMLYVIASVAFYPAMAWLLLS